MAGQTPQKIIVYSAPGWGGCNQVKGFLSQKNLKFEVRDITADESAQQELLDMGFTAIPVTLVGNNPPILGADFKRIEKALAAQAQET